MFYLTNLADLLTLTLSNFFSKLSLSGSDFQSFDGCLVFEAKNFEQNQHTNLYINFYIEVQSDFEINSLIRKQFCF